MVGYGSITKVLLRLKNPESVCASQKFNQESEGSLGLNFTRATGYLGTLSQYLTRAGSLSQATVDKQIKALKRLVRIVTPRVFQGSAELELFKPGTSRENDLTGIGMTKKHATLSLNICIDSRSKVELANKLISLGMVISKRDLDAFFKVTNTSYQNLSI